MRNHLSRAGTKSTSELVSDNYGVYRKWAHMRQTCLAHLICSTAEGLAGRKDPVLAWLGKRVRSELQRLIHWANAPPTEGEVAAWYARMSHLINLSKGRKDESRRLARLLDAEMASLWVFLLKDGVDPINNRAERALRLAVIWRRMMQGSFNEKGDRWVERILSLRETKCTISESPCTRENLSTPCKARKSIISWASL